MNPCEVWGGVLAVSEIPSASRAPVVASRGYGLANLRLVTRPGRPHRSPDPGPPSLPTDRWSWGDPRRLAHARGRLPVSGAVEGTSVRITIRAYGAR